MDINLDILKKIISEKVDVLKRMDLKSYEWKERLQNNEEDFFAGIDSEF
jgi:hypothetical protein